MLIKENDTTYLIIKWSTEDVRQIFDTEFNYEASADECEMVLEIADRKLSPEITYDTLAIICAEYLNR